MRSRRSLVRLRRLKLLRYVRLFKLRLPLSVLLPLRRSKYRLSSRVIILIGVLLLISLAIRLMSGRIISVLLRVLISWRLRCRGSVLLLFVLFLIRSVVSGSRSVIMSVWLLRKLRK